MFILILITSGLTQSIPEIINSTPNSTWVAVDYPPSIMNKMKHNSQISNHITSHKTEPYRDNSNVPSDFDARKQWPGLILGVRDQGNCGACWAFSIAENIGNRLGILKCSRGFMSPQDLISCNDFGSGCKGGYLLQAWEFAVDKGLATDKCISYSASNLPCPKSCNDGMKIKRTPISKFRFVNSTNIQDEIYKNSTVSANMIVYSDFMNYKSGVYVHQTGLSTGSHAVIIIGWGIENNIPYWLVQNSWGQDWGEKGYFKIIRGNDHCGIESSVTTGDPKCVKE